MAGNKRVVSVYNIVLLLFLVIKNLTMRPIAEDTICLSHRAWQNQRGKEAEASSLLTGFHTAGRCYASYWRRQVIISHVHLQTVQAVMMTDLTRPAHWCKSTTNIMGVSNHFLLLYPSPSPQDQTHIWHH